MGVVGGSNFKWKSWGWFHEQVIMGKMQDSRKLTKPLLERAGFVKLSVEDSGVQKNLYMSGRSGQD